MWCSPENREEAASDICTGRCCRSSVSSWGVLSPLLAVSFINKGDSKEYNVLSPLLIKETVHYILLLSPLLIEETVYYIVLLSILMKETACCLFY